MLYPLSYGRKCCPEVPCGIAQSNDGKDYRLTPSPTKSVCRLRRPAAAYPAGRRHGAEAPGRVASARAASSKGKKRNGFEGFLQRLQEACKRSGLLARL